MRYDRMTLMTLTTAAMLSSGVSFLHAQPVQKKVPPDPDPQAPAREQLQREGDEFPAEKLIPPAAEPNLRLEYSDRTVADRYKESAKILKIEKDVITIQPKESDDPVRLVVTRDAKITLNRRPVSLKDLQAGDYVLVSESVGQSGTISKLDVGRSVHVGAAPGAVKKDGDSSPRAEGLPEGEGGALGMIISDSPGLGVLIARVHPETPAWRAGLNAGDYLMRVEGQSIRTPEDYQAVMRNTQPDGSVKLVIWREGRIFSGMSKLMDATNAKDAVVENGLSQLYVDDEEHPALQLEPVVVEARKPVTVHKGDTTTIIESDENLNLQEYGELIKEHRLLQKQLESLNRKLEQLKTEERQE